jgi:hypothetical protein
MTDLQETSDRGRNVPNGGATAALVMVIAALIAVAANYVWRASGASPAIDLATFELEEYKATQAKINQFRDTLSRLETFTVGGTVVAVGFLLGIGRSESDTVPLAWWVQLFAWWAVFLLVLVATIRCWSYYVYIFHLRKYVMQIEQTMQTKGYKWDGIETFSQGKWLFRLYKVMALIWAVMILAIFILAIIATLTAIHHPIG